MNYRDPDTWEQVGTTEDGQPILLNPSTDQRWVFDPVTKVYLSPSVYAYHYRQRLAEAAPALLDLVRRYRRITEVLGDGVGKIATPDGFFKLWNETERDAAELLAKLDP